MKLLAALLATVTFLPTAHAASLKTIRLLDGKVTFAVPSDLGQVNRQPRQYARSVDLIALESSDHRLSVLATYGRLPMLRRALPGLLDGKVNAYTNSSARYPHFRWIDHVLVERQGREWAQVCFTHDLPPASGGEAYSRSVSTVLEGHLLEVWALSRAAHESSQRAAVDRIIDSLQVPH